MSSASPVEQTVLVVDDDPDILDTVAAILDSEGYRVLTARHGGEALELLRGGERPSVILLDLMMPVMNGWELRAEQLRHPELASIPVVLFTGSRSAALEPELRGAVILSKPVALDTLLATVRRLSQ